MYYALLSSDKVNMDNSINCVFQFAAVQIPHCSNVDLIRNVSRTKNTNLSFNPRHRVIGELLSRLLSTVPTELGVT